MRNMFAVDWALGFTGTLEKNVQQLCPQYFTSWPLLRSFKLEAYGLPHNYVLLILCDKLSGVHVGPSEVSPFPHTNHPQIPPVVEEISLWQFYINKTFNLSSRDVGFLIPAHDSGRSNVGLDYALFSPQEQYYWHQQFNFILSSQMQWMESIMKPVSSNAATYNVSGANSRINVGSTDNSINVVHADNSELFNKMRDLLMQISDPARRTAIASVVDDMEQSVGQETFTQHYIRFISIAADHVGVFAALLPAISVLLG